MAQDMVCSNCQNSGEPEKAVILVSDLTGGNLPMALGPKCVPAFAMMMLGSTPHGDAYTFAEYDRMFRKAGFARNEMRELAPAPNRVIVSYK